jgi:hypothetical protein
MDIKFDYLQALSIAIAAAIAAYFDSTITFLAALLVAFTFNILAGFRADEVHIKIQRFFPPIFLKNFQGNKLKDSLIELLLITSISYLLKIIADLMKYQSQSAYVVQFLIAIAIYYYFRNGLNNLKTVYPKNRFISVVYHLISFKFRQLVGADVADIIDHEETSKEAQK